MGIGGSFLKLVENFLSNRYQRVALDGKPSSWIDVKAGFCARNSFLCSFLIYINDLSENLKSTGKLFADDTSIFDVVKDLNTSGEMLKHDLRRISEWTYN